MELKAKIRTKIHDLAVGASFSEELSETLDSGAIIIDNSPEFKLRPYDDVFIYDGTFSGVPLPYGYNALNITTTESQTISWGSDVNYGSEISQSQNTSSYTASGMTKFANWFFNYTPLNENEAPYKFNNLKIRISMAYDSGSGVVITTFYEFVARETHSQAREIRFYNPAFGTFIGSLNPITKTLTISKSQSVSVLGVSYSIWECDILLSGLNYYKNRIATTDSYTFFMSSTDADQIFTNLNRKDEKILFRINGNVVIPTLSVYTNEFELDFDILILSFTPTTGGYQAIISSTSGTTIEFISWIYFTKRGEWTQPTFYKHFLVDTFTKERVNLIDNVWKYKITLFSETKGLEKIQIPNRAFKQPFNIDKKQSVAQIVKRLVEQYSPKIKVVYNATTKTYVQQQKYWLDDSVLEIYKDVYVEIALNNPTLRDLLNYFFSTKDRIAVVRDDVIYAVDQTERIGEFAIDNDINFISESMSSENYAGHLKRNYNKAIAQEKSGRMVEYLGFRDRTSGILTLDNLKLETRYDIYNVDRVLMCYYKKVQDQVVGEAPQDKMILVKQDITPLVVEETKRQLLSKDWNDFIATPPTTVQDLGTYRLATVGYKRGGKEISGWGTIYTYPQGWWDNTKSYLENIIIFMDAKYQFGINTYGYLKENISENKQISASYLFPNDFIHPFSNLSQGLKGIFFVVEYTPFYDGAVIHSKDNAESDIVANDNPSSSLSVLEADGLFQKEKINRLGNAIYQINAVHSGYSGIRSLQTTYGDDIVIFKREYAIYNDVILASYNGTKDFVLKNYFTSVFSKIRPFPLMSYDESVIRAENKKVFMLLSKNTIYNDTQLDLSFANFTAKDNLLLSGLRASPILKSVGNFDKSEKVNAGYFLINNEKYLSDINVFVSGYSLCFNLQMFDNISAGTYWKNLNVSGAGGFVGTEQKDYIAVDDVETGFIEKMGVYVCHLDQADAFNDKVDDFSQAKVNSIYTNVLMKMPKLSVAGQETNVIGNTYLINKENQEKLDFTFQIEPITTDDVLVSQWLMKLCDLYGVYNRVASTYTITDTNGTAQLGYIFSSTLDLAPDMPTIQIDLPVGSWASIPNNKPITAKDIVFNADISGYGFGTLTYKLLELVGKNANALVIRVSKSLKVGTIIRNSIQLINFYRFGYKPSGFDSISSFDPRYPYGWNTDTTDMYSYGWIKGLDYVIGDIEGSATYENGYTREMIPAASKLVVSSFLGSSLPGYINIDDTTTSISNTYTKNMYLLVSTTPLKKTLVYDEYKLASLPSNYSVYPDDVGSGFLIKQDALGVYIEVSLTNPIVAGKKSLEYWFLDSQSNSLKFVMGVNITNAEIVAGVVKIRVSFIGNVDKRVFNNQSQLVGERANYYGTTLPLDKTHYIDIIE